MSVAALPLIALQSLGALKGTGKAQRSGDTMTYRIGSLVISLLILMPAAYGGEIPPNVRRVIDDANQGSGYELVISATVSDSGVLHLKTRMTDLAAKSNIRSFLSALHAEFSGDVEITDSVDHLIAKATGEKQDVFHPSAKGLADDLRQVRLASINATMLKGTQLKVNDENCLQMMLATEKPNGFTLGAPDASLWQKRIGIDRPASIELIDATGNVIQRVELPGITRWGKVAQVAAIKIKIHKVVIERAPITAKYVNGLTSNTNNPVLTIYWTVTNADPRRTLGYQHNVLDRVGEVQLRDDIEQNIRGVAFESGSYRHTYSLNDVDDINAGETKWHATSHTVPPPKTKSLTAEFSLDSFNLKGKSIFFEIPTEKVEGWNRQAK